MKRTAFFSNGLVALKSRLCALKYAPATNQVALHLQL